MTNIDSVLSADEWKRLEVEREVRLPGAVTARVLPIGGGIDLWGAGGGRATFHLPADATAALIAVLNDSLPESDRRKVTRDKLAAMRNSATKEMGGAEGDPDDRAVYAFANALESYLPQHIVEDEP